MELNKLKITLMLAYAHDLLEDMKAQATPQTAPLMAVMDEALNEAVDWTSMKVIENEALYAAVLHPVRLFVLNHRHRADFNEMKVG